MCVLPSARPGSSSSVGTRWNRAVGTEQIELNTITAAETHTCPVSSGNRPALPRHLPWPAEAGAVLCK